MKNHGIRERVEHLSHYIPSQGPIKDFIHHNTLHAFQSMKFDQAVWKASHIFGANYSLSKKDLQSFFDHGKIDSLILKQKGISDLSSLPERDQPRGMVLEGLRRNGFLKYGIKIETEVHEVLFRLLGYFLDQGISHQNQVQELSFWGWVKLYFSESTFTFNLFKSPTFSSFLDKTPEEVIESCLGFLVEREAEQDRYLLEMLLSHPGWSGLIQQVSVRPQGLFQQRKISLIEVLALEILMDRLVAEKIKDFKKLSLDQGLPLQTSEVSLEFDSVFLEHRKVQEALEVTYYQDVKSRLISKKGKKIQERGRRFQAFFCIDDRECSLRRHLEEATSDVTTYGWAGFFGLDCLVQEAGYPYAVQSCPVILTPKVVIREKEHEEVDHSHTFHHGRLSRLFSGPFKGLLYSPFFGIQAAFNMIRHVFLKQDLHVKNRVKTDLEIGYTFEERVERVYNVLRNTGFVPEGSKLVFILGHEASSSNNPHYAAYDCGACSGRSGIVNARAFAQMANDPEVRKKLADRGMLIPADCYFIGGAHNTTRDEIHFTDTDRIPQSHHAEFQEFQLIMNRVLPINALERCKKFELAPQGVDPDHAWEHVRERATALFEPRPELNHATNAGCIVGRRSLTEGLNFDRRMFLNSYNPMLDPEGVILTGILNAVVPVCGGINLEYYFSRMDPEVYGAGTKLPHNVVGLFGVSNGVASDLRTGLPTQMTEMHDPVRLLIVVEHSPEVALTALKRNPATYEWVENDWVKYACISPEGDFFWWNNGEWQKELMS